MAVICNASGLRYAIRRRSQMDFDITFRTMSTDNIQRCRWHFGVMDINSLRYCQTQNIVSK